MPSSKPEVLAPAGDADAMRAAVRSGADAVYFGLKGPNFNARARAANFEVAELPATMQMLHAHGVKGFVTLNTLVFDHELPAMEDTIRACAAAGVDAVIVQDLGVVQLVKAIAPTLEVHASTQMTCTDASSVQLAVDMGASRVVVARELSVDEIASIREATGAELEVFVHGALCVSYSGQCLTSEAIGGRSANRGACAQACRLPYDLVVDGKVQDLGDVAYLLSPQDLEASALVAQLARVGVASLKIEGRMKGPEYVASATRLYRTAVDDAGAAAGDPSLAKTLARSLAKLRGDAMATYSRGSGPGFLAGVNHQALVEGKTCDHRGIEIGSVCAVVHKDGKAWLEIDAFERVERGAGVLVEGGKAGEGERGGRVWEVEALDPSFMGEMLGQQDRLLLWLGPDVSLAGISGRRRLFKNDDPAIDARILTEVERAPWREPLDVVVAGSLGAPLTLSARSARGLVAVATSDAPLEAARERALDEALVRDKLGRLGDTPYTLRDVTMHVEGSLAIAPSSLNRARRALVDALARSASRAHATTDVHVDALLTRTTLAAALTDRAPPPAGLFVLCRTQAQAEAAFDAGADGVWLDFLALNGTRAALEALRARASAASRAFSIGVAPPRIRKPGEEKIDRFLLDLAPDAFLVRGLGAVREMNPRAGGPVYVGDFSLNVTNRVSAHALLARGLAAFTPSFDLDAAQLGALLATELGRFAELVVHHPMPLFHTEHCVFAALMSEGRDFRTCGRPCESHVIALRDRVGLDNPVEADVGCRNTVFHAQSQSAASQVAHAQKSGVTRFRVELVRESAADVARIVTTYTRLLKGDARPREVFEVLRTDEGYGVVRGSLRVLT